MGPAGSSAPVASTPASRSGRRPGAAMSFDHSETTEAPEGAWQNPKKQHRAQPSRSPSEQQPDISIWAPRARSWKKKKKKQHHHHPSCCSSSSPSPLSLFSFPHSFCSTFLLLFLTVILFCRSAAAEQQHQEDRHPRSPSFVVDQLAHQDLDPTWKGPAFLVVDKSPRPPSPFMPHLFRRDGAPTTTSSAGSPSKTLSTDPKASTETSIPRPFDTALGNNFTAPCAAWFRKFLANDMLNACHPFSLLLQTSSSFFDASKSFARITHTLEATCNVNTTVCLDAMNQLARQVKDDSNCAVDYANDNPSVLQAYNGLVAYQPLYQAACLRDGGGNYCFANAITNASAVTDPYPYSLPLGMPMPGGARPTCSTCLQNTMAIFSSFAGNTTQPISRTYNDAAQHIGLYCGPSFVNRTATPLKGAAPAFLGPAGTLTGTITLVIMLVLFFLEL